MAKQDSNEPLILKLNKILDQKCDPEVVKLHKEFETKLGLDNSMVKAMAAQVAEGGKAASEEMIGLIKEMAQSSEPMLPMTAEDFKTKAVDEGMTNDEAKVLRQKRVMKNLGDGPMSKDKVSESLGFGGQAFLGVMDSLIEDEKVLKVGDDYSLAEEKEVVSP
jgi:hypothetical protein